MSQQNDKEIINEKSTIGKRCTFPDLSSFPIDSILDLENGYKQVCYYHDGVAQIVWVPENFITND